MEVTATLDVCHCCVNDPARGRVPAHREKAGLPEDLVLYCGRHDYGTRVLSNTGNLAAVMKTMGHKDAKTAMKYQHPELEIVRTALNQVSGPVMQTSA
jgi:site-specific recombinase XerD